MPSNGLFRLLFLGDIVGPIGREAVKTYLSKNTFDFVIANGENTTHGHGLSYQHYNELLSYGIDALTSGNHFFNSKDVFNPKCVYEKQVRPYNFDRMAPGVGTKVFTAKDGTEIRITNLIGRVFTGNLAQTSPFYDFDQIYQEAKNGNAIHFVDFHAEATAEKRVFGEYVDGRVTAVIGTHTHVQTNDAKLLSKGTFFLTDCGMNGEYDSCLGDDKEKAIYRTITGMPSMLEVNRTGKKMVNGAILNIDRATNKVVSFSLVNEVFD